MRINTNSFIYLGIVLAVFASFYIFKDKLILPQNDNANFCTLNDPVVQTIKTDLDDWLIYFPDANPILGFNVASGASYTVDGSLWTDDSPVLFIVADRSPQERYGKQGYWYSKSDKAYIDPRYTFQKLEGDIYCYRLKSPRP